MDADRQIGISSLRADRLTDEIVGLLKQGGYRTLTTASDGASERLRAEIQRKTKERHLLRAAELCTAHKLRHLKVYMMLGLPGETMDDIDELARFGIELAAVAPKVVFGIAPFVAKRQTPLDRAPFEGIAAVEAKLDRLRRAVKGRVELRPTSPKWAWVEYRLAQGGFAAGMAAARAARAGAVSPTGARHWPTSRSRFPVMSPRRKKPPECVRPWPFVWRHPARPEPARNRTDG